MLNFMLKLDGIYIYIYIYIYNTILMFKYDERYYAEKSKFTKILMMK